MDISEIIRKLTGGMEPDQAVVSGANAAIPPPNAPPPQQQATPPTAPAVPQGVPTPVTNPKPVAQTPQAYQSPSDLANMYVQLMKDNRNAAQLDSGLNLIAAGLSNSPTNRAALIQGASDGHGAGGMSLSANDMINFQKQADAQKQQLVMQQALPALMKQYKMTPAQIQALQASDKLGDVLKHYSTENLGTAVDAETGKHILFNQRTGQHIATLGGEKADETITITRPDGSQYLANKETGKPVSELAPGTKPGDVIPAQEQELFAINKAREARGEKPLIAEELIKMKQNPATNINVGTDGSTFPAPEKGFDYERGVDGKVIVDPATHRPKLYKIEGGGPADEAAALAKKEVKATEKEALGKVQQTSAYLNVKAAADEALKHVDTLGVVGIGSKIARSPSSPTSGIGGLPHDVYDSALKTIQSNVTISTLAQMRAASPTGGALGNVSDFEDKMLQSVIAPLNTYTSPAEARRGINRVVATLELLANDNFNKDPAKFKEALDKRVMEMGTSGKSGVKVERIK